MTTIREHLTSHHAQRKTVRLQRLLEIGAPAVVMQAEADAIAQLVRGQLAVKGSPELLDLELATIAWHTGNGGKPWAMITTSCDEVVRYFPFARYGALITR